MSMGEHSVPTSLGVVVIPIAPKLKSHQQQVSIVSKQNNCSISTPGNIFELSTDILLYIMSIIFNVSKASPDLNI